MNLLMRMTQNLTLVIPLAMLLGLLYSVVAPTGWLGVLIVPLTLLMVYPMMVNLKLRKLLEECFISAGSYSNIATAMRSEPNKSDSFNKPLCLRSDSLLGKH